MDNMKYYNDSLAYDFEMFAAKPAKKTEERDNVVTLPKRNTKKRVRAAKRLSPAMMAVLIMVVVLAAMCANISLRLKINEVSAQITTIKQEINEKKSEKIALEMEMQKRISYDNLELEASQLGMRKMEKDDVVYITVNQKNTAKTVDGKLDMAEE